MDRCNFRCPYCMPRETFHEPYRFLKSSERLDFDEMLRLARLFVRAGVRKLRITGGEPLLRAEPRRPRRRSDRAPRHRGRRADHQRRAARASTPASSRRRACKRITVSLDTLDPDSVREDERRLRRRGARCSTASSTRGAPASRRSRSTPSCSAASTTTPCSIWSSTSAAPASSCASSSTWTSARAITGPRWSCRRASSRPHPRALADRAARARTTAAKSPSATPSRTARGEIGFISSVSQPFCGDCSRARLSSDGRSTRACSPRRARTCARRCAPAPATTSWSSSSAASGADARDRYSELRASMRDAAELHKVEMNYIGG